MRFDTLINPVSDDEPCGPDLDEVGDDQYLNYMLGADNRMPQRYLDAETGQPFDRAQIDLKVETKTISEFLEQSRDLRLLTLEARFQALAGQVTGFCECLHAMAALLEAHWDDVHPKGYEGDFTLRQNIVGVLEDRTTIVFPLQYAPLLRDQRAGPISLHDYQISIGKAEAREEERTIDVNQIVETFRSESHRATVDGLHASIQDGLSSLTKIKSAFDERTNYDYSPSFDLLRAVLSEILAFIVTARPDLAGSSTAVEDGDAAAVEGGGSEASEDGSSAASAVAVSTSVKVGKIEIGSHAAASAALLAAEKYFGAKEPSSPALLLVHEARQLIGKPLVAALEALVPDNVEYASIVVDASVGFTFNMTKMRAIVEDYAATAEEVYSEEEIPEYSATTRPEAVALITGVSAFFRAVEPSSPIPMVLSRAERFVSQSFQTILSDLMPKPSPG
jgi:type VI secretion system protein ImpA